MSDTYVVKWVETNKFGYGNVKVEGGEDLHEKGMYGFGTGERGMPACKKGDTITADIGPNAKGYPEINNIKVVSSGASAPTKSGGGAYTPRNNDTQDQIMRQSAIKAAIENRTEVTVPIELIADADIFFEYYKNGMESETIKGLLADAAFTGGVDTLADEA
jgi:hypothetical protein